MCGRGYAIVNNPRQIQRYGAPSDKVEKLSSLTREKNKVYRVELPIHCYFPRPQQNFPSLC